MKAELAYFLESIGISFIGAVIGTLILRLAEVTILPMFGLNWTMTWNIALLCVGCGTINGGLRYLRRVR